MKYKDCFNCLHEDKTESEEPCCKCEFGIKSSDPNYKNAPLLWEPKNDMVNHPAHYETGKFECIDVMIETQGVGAVKDFCICNAFKYLYRHRAKNGTEDIKKAIWYLNKYIELSENEKPTM